MIVWKKALISTGPVILKLSIPIGKEAVFVFFSTEDNKHRASIVKVLEIQDLKGKKLTKKEAFGKHDSTFKYIVGNYAISKNGFNHAPEACVAGIHFFMTRNQAVNW